MDAKSIIISIVAIMNSGLALLVLFRKKKEQINFYFSFFVCAVAFWCVSMVVYRAVDTVEYSMLWSRILYFSAITIPLTFLYFTYLFLLGKDALSPLKKILILLPAVILAIISLLPNVLIKDIVISAGKEKEIIFSTIPYAFYFFYIVIYFSWNYLLLIREFIKSTGVRRLQIKYVLIGTISSGFLGMTTNLILPTFGIFTLNWLGQILTLVLVFSVGYAITKHHLLNVKVIATEILVFVVGVSLLVKTTLSNSINELILNSGLLVLVIISGALLIKSVLGEIKQREKLEVLTKEIKEAYEVEKKARKDLERLDEAKSQFTMATQHHLRTPLTSMRGYVELILGGTYGKVPPRLKEPIMRFKVSTNRLIRIVNEFLDISQFQLGKKVVSCKVGTPIDPILDEIMEELKFEAEHKGIYLKLERPEKLDTIKADPDKLKVALFNLADNAVKYTSEGGVIIKVENGEKLKLSISDTGIGISKEDIAKLFKRTFERGREAKEVFATGRGIGLFITSQIIQAHNGKIWVESAGEGKGSTFHIEIPTK